MAEHPPRVSLGRRHLPWALVRVRENVAVRLQGVDCARESACAKGVAASTSRGAGTNVIARTLSASGRSASGKRHGGRPSIARPSRPKPDMPRPKKHAVSESNPCPRPLRIPNLHRRVVTQQELFFPSVMQSAGLSRTPRDLIPQPGTVLLLRLPSGGSQCPGSRTQVAHARHLGRTEETELRVPSRTSAPTSTTA